MSAILIGKLQELSPCRRHSSLSWKLKVGCMATGWVLFCFVFLRGVRGSTWKILSSLLWTASKRGGEQVQEESFVRVETLTWLSPLMCDGRVIKCAVFLQRAAVCQPPRGAWQRQGRQKSQNKPFIPGTPVFQGFPAAPQRPSVPSALNRNACVRRHTGNTAASAATQQQTAARRLPSGGGADVLQFIVRTRTARSCNGQVRIMTLNSWKCH